MAYNLTEVDASTNFGDMAVALNDVAGGLISLMVLSVFAIILFVAFIDKKDDIGLPGICIAVGSIVSLVSVLFWAIGLIDVSVLWYPFIFTILAIIVKLFARE